MIRSTTRRFSLPILFLTLAALVAIPALAEGPAVGVERYASGVTFAPQIDAAGFVLRVSGPEGYTFEQRTKGASPLNFELGANTPDGYYKYEVTLEPRVSREAQAAMEKARQSGEMREIEALRSAGKLAVGQVESGSFRVDGGIVFLGGGEESNGREQGAAEIPNKAQVIANDLVVQGSTCTGFDCVNGESFGFDTLRLKENNLRIHFNDTSVSASFPSNDWRLVANDTGNGGTNHFSIEDSTAGRSPFRVEAGAPANTLVVEADGDVGVKTLNPVVDIHVVEGNTPTLRLEQDGSDGFTPQTFDVAANEANFFIRDVTNGSKLSFRIRPNAPESSIDIAGDGDVGFGTSSPDSPIHVRRTTQAVSQLLHLQRTDSGFQQMVLIENNGGSSIQLNNTEAGGTSWNMSVFNASAATPNALVFGTPDSPGQEFILETDGDAVFTGTVMGSSDRHLKTNVQAAEGILDQVLDLPISKWSFKKSPDQRHMGPMAQDFYAAFGLGPDDRHIAARDLGGVALAAIQELSAEVDSKDEQIETLTERIAALEALVASMAGASE